MEGGEADSETSSENFDYLDHFNYCIETAFVE